MTHKPILEVLNGEVADTTPIWLMRQAGRYLPEYKKVRAKIPDFLSLCYNPDLAAEVTLQPIRRFGLDAAIVFSDILVIPDALGQKVEFYENSGPILHPLSSVDDIARLKCKNVAQHLDPVYQAINIVAQELSDKTALIGFSGAPWTVATYMVEGASSRDFTKVKRWAIAEPVGFQRLIDVLVDSISEHLIRQVSAGAEIIQIFDTWAGVLPSLEFQKWCISPVKEIVRRLQKHKPWVPIIGFPRGIGVNYKYYAFETGVNAVSIDSSVPLGWVETELKEVNIVQGNMDPIVLLAGGKPMIETCRSIEEVLGRGQYIFNLGHGVNKETPPENITAVIEEIRGQ